MCGRCSRPARVRASRLVPLIRLWVIACRRARVQRPRPTFSPARCTTASTPSKAPGLIVPRAGSQGISWSEAAGRRTRVSTRLFRSRRAGMSACPTSPEAPLSASRMGAGSVVWCSHIVSLFAEVSPAYRRSVSCPAGPQPDFAQLHPPGGPFGDRIRMVVPHGPRKPRGSRKPHGPRKRRLYVIGGGIELCRIAP